MTVLFIYESILLFICGYGIVIPLVLESQEYIQVT